MLGAEQVHWLDRLDQEHENLRAALRWCLECEEREMALHLASALWPFWWLRGHQLEGRTMLTQTLSTQEQVPAAIRAKALAGAGQLAFVLGDQDQAEACCEESLALLRQLEDQRGMIMPLLAQGFLASELNSNFGAARQLGEEALAISRQVAFLWGIASSLRLLAIVAGRQGRYAAARALGKECLVVSRKLGSSRAIADALFILGQVIAAESDLESDLVRGCSLIAESLALYKEVGDERSIAQALAMLGQVAISQDEYTQGQVLLQESLENAAKVGDQLALVWGHIGQAMAALRQGDYPLARELLYEDCVRMLRQSDNTPKRPDLVSCLMGLGTVLSAQGEPAGAARLWGAVEMLWADMAQYLMLSLVRMSYEQYATSARGQLGPEAFAAAWGEGRTMTAEQALASLEPATFPGPPSAPSSPSALSTLAPQASTSPDVLTAREMDVLRLLAQGLTSTQMAERLVIGVVTVNFHVLSIYSKLGVSSRSAATRYALEHHLL